MPPLVSFAPRIILVALSLIVSTLMATGSAFAGLYDAKSFKLDNGLEVVVIEDHRAPVVTHMAWYRVGGADEPMLKSGIAHLLEHLMFKGTDTIAPGEFSKIVAQAGGQENAFTGHDYTAYYQVVSKDNLPRMMALEADRMANLRITEEHFRTERDVVLEEQRQRTGNEPDGEFQQLLAAARYTTYPYRTPVIGWPQELQNTTLDEVIDFYKKHYAPGNAYVIVAGDVTLDEVKKLAAETYGKVAARETAKRLRPAVSKQIAARRLSMSSPQIHLPKWSLSYMVPSMAYGNDDIGSTDMAPALEVLSRVLGDGSTSRLYQELVVKQKVATSAGAYYSGDRLGPSQFYFYGTPGPDGDVMQIEQAVRAVIKDIQDNGITQAELDRIKDRFLTGLIFGRDSVRGAANLYGQLLGMGWTVDQVNNWESFLKDVTREQVQEAAKAIFEERRAVVGIVLPEPEGAKAMAPKANEKKEG